MLTSRARSAALTPILVILAVLALVPSVSQGQLLAAMTLGLIYGVAGVGLDIFSGYGGQLSFGHFGFVAIGAYTSAVLSTDHGWNVWLTLPASVVVAGAIGAVLSVPTVKVADLGTALVTFFFAYLVNQLLTGHTLADVTHSADGIGVVQAGLGSQSLLDPKVLFYTCLVCLALVCLLSWRYANSASGVALRVVKRSKVVATANGIAVNRVRRWAMTYSAAVAGLAGFLLAQASGYLAPESFGALVSVNLMAMVVLGGMGSVIGPVLGGIFFAVVNQSSLGSSALAGAIFPAALLIALIVLPDGFYGLGERIVGAVRPNRRKRVAVREEVPEQDPTQPITQVVPDVGLDESDELLSLQEVSVSFGGVAALSGVSLTARSGRVHAIMGPNGAGKTTLLNCVSGVQPHGGSVTLRESRLSGLDSRQIRRLGVARTFQAPSLVADLDVLENVSIGVYDPLPWWSLGGLVPVRRRRASTRAAEAALDLLEFPRDRRHLLAGDLTLAEQKIVDVARAVVGRPSLVLLDEPTAGLDEHEMQQMASALDAVRAAGVTILVIAHHVDFLRRVADDLTVLNFGEVIASGSPEDVLAQQQVVDIYLGSARV